MVGKVKIVLCSQPFQSETFQGTIFNFNRDLLSKDYRSFLRKLTPLKLLVEIILRVW